MSTGVEALDRLAESLPKTSDKQREAKLDADVLPSGRRVSDLSAEELGRELKRLGIPGASPGNTIAGNRAAYEQFLQEIRDFAAELSVLTWFQENKHDGSSSDDDDTDSEGNDDVRDQKD
jgi:hypothetical protein